LDRRRTTRREPIADLVRDDLNNGYARVIFIAFMDAIT